MEKKVKPNPQGKGTNRAIGFLLELETTLQLPRVENDSRKRIVEDYVLSLVALSCKFKFKPVMGKRYYMYLLRQRWVLSLIAPEEGGVAIFEEFLAHCRLREDTTWEMQFVKGNGPDLIRGVGTFREYFDTEPIDDDQLYDIFETLSDSKIGKYRKDLGFYQNALNFTLGKAIGFRARRLMELEGGRTWSDPARLVDLKN